MLATLDLEQLFGCMFANFGECQIRFIPMTPIERAMASTKVGEIEAVNERFLILRQVDADFVRQHALEEKVARVGQK